MEFNTYQDIATGTAVYPGDSGLSYTALGLTGEAGEVANKVKKVLRDCGGVLNEEFRAAIIDELGDTLWYLSACAGEVGADLSEVAELNLEKLLRRKEAGTLRGSGDKR